jgi:hypothetical protein
MLFVMFIELRHKKLFQPFDLFEETSLCKKSNSRGFPYLRISPPPSGSKFPTKIAGAFSNSVKEVLRGTAQVKPAITKENDRARYREVLARVSPVGPL